MNTRTTTVFVITGVIASILLFAAGPIVATYQAWAYGGCGGWRHHIYGPYSGGNGGNGPYSGGNGGNGPYSGGNGGNGPYSGGNGGNGWY
jgi:hypothetical protein